jgi:Cu+-exporting ATPase
MSLVLVDQKLADVSDDRDKRQYQDQNRSGSTVSVAHQTVIDPVCGMTVDPHAASHRHQHQGLTYYFCSAECRTKFATDPQNYLSRTRARAAVPEGTIYTCPMHPEIRQVGPGTCPICGMALEPDLATAEAGPNPELVDMTRRFWIGLVLTLPVFVLEMGSHIVDIHTLIDASVSSYVQFAFATPVVLWVGWPFFARGARNLNMFSSSPWARALRTSTAW